MSSCHSGDHIAGDRIHTDIATCNIEEPQQKYRTGTVNNRLPGKGGGSNMFSWAQTSPSSRFTKKKNTDFVK